MKLTPKEAVALSNGQEVSQIQRLNVSNKGIDSVVGLDALTSCVRLDASANALTSADGLAACSSLRWLSISKNQIPSLDPLRELEHLEVLNAAHNQLQEKVSVSRLRALKALILNNNSIVSVGGLEKLENLEALILSHNNVRALGGWLSGATRLAKLSLSNNPISEIGSALRRLTLLQELRLNHCQLRTLPNELSNNPSLRILEAGGNAIAEFSDIAVLRQLPGLRQLNLRGCPVAGLPQYEETVLQMVPRLEVLDSRKLPQARREGRDKERGRQPLVGADGDDAPSQPEATTKRHAGDKDGNVPSARGEKGKKERTSSKRTLGDLGQGGASEAQQAELGERSRKKKGKDSSREMTGHGEAKAVKAASVYAAVQDESEDDALDPSEFSVKPLKSGGSAEADKSGVVKVVEVGKKEKKGKGRKKQGAGGGETKRARGAAAIQALLRSGGGVAEEDELRLPGWD